MGKDPLAIQTSSSVLKGARRLLTFLKKNKSSLSPLLILTHNFPDPDAIGSAIALQSLCEIAFGINSKIVYKGEIGRVENRAMVKILKIPIRKLHSSDLKKSPHLALVDTQPAFTNNPFPKTRRAALVIDQHTPIEKPNSRFSLINTHCGATCVLLAQALLLSGVKISSRVATALVYGILSDTLNLYRSNTPDVVRTYLKILPSSDLKALSHIQNPVRSKRTYTVLGRGIHNATLYKKLLVSHLGGVESPDLISQVADFLIRYKRIAWCFCTGRIKGKIYTSLRISQSYGDAARLLRSLYDDPGQAGGHDTIAGGSLNVGSNAGEEKWKAAENTFVQRLLKRLRIKEEGRPYYPFRT